MSKKKPESIVPALVVGTALILFPEPATTATGLLIIATAFGLKYIG